MNENNQQQDSREFTVPHPILWLGIVALIVGLPSIFFGLTRLDDYVFIVRLQHYNRPLSALFTSFTHGVFGLKDNYYRPVFVDSLMLNSWLFGGKVAGYHAVNVLLHVVSVALLYKLLVKLRQVQFHAFILALLFAVHPVLTQAVAWIPGRNDTLLAAFTFSFFIYSIDYSLKGKVTDLAFSLLFLLLALFTKETGAFAAPAAVIILAGILQINWRAKAMLVQYAAWLACGALWLAFRASAHLKSTHLVLLQMAKEFAHKLPLVAQYLGKATFPVSLSVFPTLRDTSNIAGLAAIVVIALSIFFSRGKSWRMIACGFGIFLVFTLPALLAPYYMTPQTFEHRLYLPFLGLLLVLPQTFFFKNKLTSQQLLNSFGALCVVFALANFRHQQNFANPQAFWLQAVNSSPNSAYAHMMLAMQVEDKAKAHELFENAIRLNPREQHLNYNIGITLQKEDSLLASEKYLLKEKSITNYYLCGFHLAKVALAKNDIPSAVAYYSDFINREPNTLPEEKTNILHNPLWQQPDSAKAFLLKTLRD